MYGRSILLLFLVIWTTEAFRAAMSRRARLTRSTVKMLVDDESEAKMTPMQIKIAALKAEAARFRAEAAKMEQVQAEERSKKLEEIFKSFDTNQDGEISVEELRTGLNTMFKDLALTDERAEKLLRAFDDSGDGALQLEEFTTMEAFRIKLDELIRDEKDAAIASEREGNRGETTGGSRSRKGPRSGGAAKRLTPYPPRSGSEPGPLSLPIGGQHPVRSIYVEQGT